MVSRADILRWSREGWQSEETLGDRRDKREVILGHADEPVSRLADRMVATHIARMPVIDRASGRIVGLLARRDLLRVRAHATRQEHERTRAL